MPWGGHNAHFCHVCGRHRDECGPLSARYKCAACGDGRLLANNAQLREHDGPLFDHWRRRTLAAFGIIVVDPSASADQGAAT